MVMHRKGIHKKRAPIEDLRTATNIQEFPFFGDVP